MAGPLDAGGRGGPGDAGEPTWEGEPCPTFDADADRTICAGEGHSPGSGPPATLSPSEDAVVADRDGEFVATLGATGDVPLTFDPQDWRLSRAAVEGWTTATAEPERHSRRTIYPGEEYEWTLRSPDDGDGSTGGTRVTAALVPGQYAFGVTASVGRGWTRGDRLELVATFVVRS